MVLNGGMVTFHVVRTRPLTLSRHNSLIFMGSPFGEEWITSFSTPVSFELVWDSCSDPDMTVPKWACLHIVVHLCELSLCHHTHGPIYDFGPNHDVDHSQNRMWLAWPATAHSHCSSFDPWDLEVDFHKSEVWDVEPPVLSSFNNWPRGGICSAISPQKWELMLETWGPKSISAVISCPSAITGVSLEHPTKWAIGSGVEEGTGANLWLSFLLSHLYCGLVQGQGGNAGYLLLAVAGWC